MRDLSLTLAGLFMPLALCLGLTFWQAGACHARSAFNPRHSGLEAPGERRPADGMSAFGMRPARTAEGGMGYSDAYGNTLDDQPPEEKKPRKRVHPGAYGHRSSGSPSRALPDPDCRSGVPAWTYN